METDRWALEHLPWELFFAYTPYPDEAEYLWWGFLDPSLPGLRQEIADRPRPFLVWVFQTSDDLLGLLMVIRLGHSFVTLVSYHGMARTNTLFAVKNVLYFGR